MATKYPLSMCVDELTFVGGIPKEIVAAEYTIVTLNNPSWEDFVYRKVLTFGNFLRHEVPAANVLVGGVDYEWRVRLQDGDGNWSCSSESSGGEGLLTFTYADIADMWCLDCARVGISFTPQIAASPPAYSFKFGVQDSDNSSVYLDTSSFSVGVTPFQVYRNSLSSSGLPTDIQIGSANFTHSATSDGTYIHDYLVKDHNLYVLYATNIGSNGSEAVFCRVNLSDPSVVADSMSVIWYEKNVTGITILEGLRIIDTDNGFVAFIVVDNGSGTELEAYQLSNGTWSGVAYPTVEDVSWVPAVFNTLYNYSLISFRPEPETYIVFGVQNEATGVAVYKFDIQNATVDMVYQANPAPPAHGSVPVFVNFLPGETLIRVLAAHYTVGTGAGVLSLSFDPTDLSLVLQEIIPYTSQLPYIEDAGGPTPQPHISTLTSLGRSKVVMTRSILNTVVSGPKYAEIEIFNYIAGQGELLSATGCSRAETWFYPDSATQGNAPELSLVAPLEAKFYSSSKILIPVVGEPSSRYTNGGYVAGGLLDFETSRDLLDKREYGEIIAIASGTSLESVGLRGDPGNDVIQLTIPSNTTLAGLRVSAVLDRQDPSVWSSSAWVLIRELDYAFPLVLGDETGIWPVTLSDVGVSVGGEHGAFLGASNNLTFEVFQSKDFVPGVADIIYANLSISAYTESSGVPTCTLEEVALDDFSTGFSATLNNGDETAWQAISGSIFQERRVTNYFGGNNVQISIGGGIATATGIGSEGQLVIQYRSSVDVDMSKLSSMRLTVTAFSGIGAFDTTQPGTSITDYRFAGVIKDILPLLDNTDTYPSTHILDYQQAHNSGTSMNRIREASITFRLNADNLPISCTISPVITYPQVTLP